MGHQGANKKNQSAIDLMRPEDLPRRHAMTPMEVYKLESAK
jgi:hypothetical protein